MPKAQKNQQQYYQPQLINIFISCSEPHYSNNVLKSNIWFEINQPIQKPHNLTYQVHIHKFNKSKNTQQFQNSKKIQKHPAISKFRLAQFASFKTFFELY
eukprot:TRINITY_DN26962_c0_g1_i1.p4 TRINITY_DN26962_c0_g1~~TRINITY_DN26962_c0_g1_i1.p4  ORF type:complete len:109 (+),score=7.90 TRINITY_DN26962_c0_g1_i1:29-328(+)